MKTNLDVPLDPMAGQDVSLQNDAARRLPDPAQTDLGGQSPDGMPPAPGGQRPDAIRSDYIQSPDNTPPDVTFYPDAMRPDLVPGGAVTAAHVRFLNAVTDGAPLRISLGARLLASSLSPGSLTGYFAVPAGFRVLSLFDARSPWMLLYQASLPFSPGEIITLAVVRSGGGVDLVRVDDRPCGNQGTNRACVRVANLVYNSPGLDLLLTDGRVVFTDVRYKEVTTYRRARPGRYDMYVAQTPYVLPEPYADIETVEEMPVALTDYFLPGYGVVEPLASFFLEARAGVRSTVYLMGNWNQSREIRVRVVENY